MGQYYIVSCDGDDDDKAVFEYEVWKFQNLLFWRKIVFIISIIQDFLLFNQV